MKVICIHPRFAGLTSHHFNECYGYMQEFQRRGKEFLLLINIRANAQIVAELNARAVLDDPTFRMELSFDERSERFVAMLHAQVDADLDANDLVLLTVSTQLEAHALTRWLQELPSNKRPWILILFLSDRWNRSGGEEYERQTAEFRILNSEISRLAPKDRQRLLLCSTTELLAAELSDLLGTKVDVVPIQLPYGDPQLYPVPRSNSHLPRVVAIGGTRREKGSHLLVEIVRACASLVPVEFLVHLANDNLTAQEVKRLAQIADEPRVTVIREPMTLAQYNIALNSADVALFPYEVIPYRKRISSVFAEAVAYGKPVIATRGTWMAEQIEAHRAAGTIFDELEPNAIARAIAGCITNLESLKQQAQVMSIEWRNTYNMSRFVDYMEAQISMRTG